MEDAEYSELKDRVVKYLGGLEGKGVERIAVIGKNTEMKRKQASKVIQRMEEEGLVQPAGVAPGVVGYKLKS